MYQYTQENLFKKGVPVAVAMASGKCRESIPYHCHDFMELVFVASGSTIHTVQFADEQISYALVSGDVFAVLPDEAHAYVESRNMHYYNLMFDFNFVADALVPLSSLESYQALFAPHRIRHKIHLPLHERKKLENVLQLISSELAATQTGYAEFVHAALIEALIMILRNDPVSSVNNPHHDYSGIARSIALMENAPDKLHSAAELAREANMSTSLFYLRFQEITGVSPNEYLISIRLANACAMLLQTAGSIGEIALQSGFCDSNHFIKSFKKRYGVTPGKFRKQFQQ